MTRQAGLESCINPVMPSLANRVRRSPVVRAVVGGPRALRRVAVLLLMLLLALGLFVSPGCGRSDENKQVLRFGHGLPTTHPVHTSIEHMARLVAEKSGGQIEIKVYPSEQLGTERELIEQLQIGTIDMAKVSAAVMESFSPDYEVLNLPYIFRSREHGFAVLDGPIGGDILESGAAVGLRGLCFMDAGSRSFYTISKPIYSPDDLAGLKIRVQESPTAMELVNTLGATATPIAWGELYSALQQGVVDGAENNPPSFLTSSHYNVARFYSLNEHTAVPDVVLIAEKTWDRLTPEQRVWIQEAADEASLFQRVLWKKFSDDALTKVEADGVTIIRPDRGPFIEKVRPMLDRIRSKKPRVAEYLDRINGTP